MPRPSPKAQLANERNWMLCQLAGMQGCVKSLELRGWIHPACAKILLSQLNRAKKNVNVSWHYRKAKLPKLPAQSSHAHIVEEA